MHGSDGDINIKEVSKVEGTAGVDVKIKNGKVQEVHFKSSAHKRFFTEGMKGKPYIALPQFMARTCGTCSNAHLMCSIEACERALGIKPSEQTMLLRILTMYSLMIRDHALHLYLFVLPDIYGKDAFLEFDENNPEELQLLKDAFAVKDSGNFLATQIAGRSVHAVYPTVGGFLHFPEKDGIQEAIKRLEAVRPAALRLIGILEKAPFHFDRKTKFMAVVPERFGFLNGPIKSSNGEIITEEKFREHLEHVVLPYSQASAYKHEGECYMVGALARLNLAKDILHFRTKESLGSLLNRFPSTDIFDNNLAQAIEILHSIDDAVEILKANEFAPEPIIKKPSQEAVGIGVIEAPRGILYHKVLLGKDGIVKGGEEIVPTGQNQVNIEEDIHVLVQNLLNEKSKKEIAFEIEKLIRAYDPCISCATHFLEVNWRES